MLLYLQQHAPKLATFKELQRTFALLYPIYQGKPLSELPNIARKYANDQTGILSSGTVRNRLAYLRSACRWAWKTHEICQQDPTARMQLPPPAKARRVYLDRREMLLTAKQMRGLAGKQGMRRARAAMRIAFYSGMRRGEVLREQIVQSEDGLAFCLHDTKNGEDRFVPIHSKLAHIVRNKTLWPVTLHPDTVSHYTKRAMIDANLGHARLHDLRHSTASAMINAGVPLYTVGAVLGHKSPVSTQRYAHLATASLRAALGTVGGKGKNSRTNPEAKAA